ncbi:HNH endonuclease [Lutibacter sp. B2]|nr:HNH endonuclease [Lutibacter sp. B2]
MKLIDFDNFKPFEILRSNMQISKNSKVSLKLNTEFKAIDWDEVSTVGKGVDLENLDVNPDGTISIEGRNVIIYIRDMYSIDNLSRFHVAWCSTLSKMRDNKKMNRYVMSARTDGSFFVNVRDSITHTFDTEQRLMKLPVCKNCLAHINYKKYQDTYGPAKYAICDNFDIGEFLNKYDINLQQLPKYTTSTAPLNEYPDNWSTISKTYRTLKKWKCEKCGDNFTNNTRGLDVHHIDSDTSNCDFSNLKALCKDCHSKEFGHGHYKKLLGR